MKLRLLPLVIFLSSLQGQFIAAQELSPELRGTEKKVGLNSKIPEISALRMIPNKPKIYVSLSVHVEGREECPSVQRLGGAPSATDCDATKYEKHLSDVQKLGEIFVDSANGIALPLSLELEEQFMSAAKALKERGSLGARLDSLISLGHSLGPHADAHAYHEANSSRGMKEHFTYLRDTLLSSEVQASLSSVSTLSGVCASGDWPKVAESLGFNNIAGIVSFCLRSLPVGSVPQFDIPSNTLSDTVESVCRTPSDCHATYPYLYFDSSSSKFEITRATRPWRTDSKLHWMGGPGATLWTASIHEGSTVIVPGVGTLYCLAEKKSATSRWESHTSCDFCQDDIETYFEILDQTINEASILAPRIVYSVYSLGKSVDTTERGCETPTTRKALLKDLATRLQQDYINTGKVQWKTVPELSDLIP
jgi:hypothetical protein